MKQRLLLIRMTFVASLIALSSFAQRSPVTGIYNVPLNEPDVIDYTIGDRQLILSLQQAARVPASFHARFLWGDKEFIRRSAKERRDGDNCVTFNARVLKVRAAAAIRFVDLPNVWWIGSQSESQIYTVVFEAGDDASEWIRLPFDDLDKYYLRNAKQMRINRSPIAALNNPPLVGDGRKPPPSLPPLIPSNLPCTPARESQVQDSIRRPGATVLVSWLVPAESCATLRLAATLVSSPDHAGLSAGQ